jgi:hypothetical protein
MPTLLQRGERLLADNRSKWARRYRDLLAAHLSDLGGPDNVSEAERSIVRRASVLEVALEQLEAKFAQAGEASAEQIDLYGRTAGNLRRLLESVGLQRRAKHVTTLGDLWRAEHAEKMAAAEREMAAASLQTEGSTK